jgi:hypothetical protein
MRSTDPPSSSDQEEVKEDIEAHTTPATRTQYAQISFSDEQEEAAGGGGGGDGSIKRVSLDGRPDSTSTMTTSSREWRSRSLPSRTETSKEEDGYPPPPQLSLMTSVHSVVSHVHDYIHHMYVLQVVVLVGG